MLSVIGIRPHTPAWNDENHVPISFIINDSGNWNAPIRFFVHGNTQVQDMLF